jgi:hypothetical protein
VVAATIPTKTSISNWRCPSKSDIAAKMQLSGHPRADSAEYYLATRSMQLRPSTPWSSISQVSLRSSVAIRRLRATATSALGARSQTTISGTWEIRVVMQRSTVSSSLLAHGLLGQVRPGWPGRFCLGFFSGGQLHSQGSARTGTGEIHFLANDVRVAGYPSTTILDSSISTTSTSRTDNAAYPTTVTMTS